jgi:tetratricopeptide (TPR) repeat protein
LQPDDADVWYNKGLTLQDLGQTEAAVAAFEKVKELQPDEIEG